MMPLIVILEVFYLGSDLGSSYVLRFPIGQLGNDATIFKKCQAKFFNTEEIEAGVL